MCDGDGSVCDDCSGDVVVGNVFTNDVVGTANDVGDDCVDVVDDDGGVDVDDDDDGGDDDGDDGDDDDCY